jgi:hypothetical protein
MQLPSQVVQSGSTHYMMWDRLLATSFVEVHDLADAEKTGHVELLRVEGACDLL